MTFSISAKPHKQALYKNFFNFNNISITIQQRFNNNSTTFKRHFDAISTIFQVSTTFQQQSNNILVAIQQETLKNSTMLARLSLFPYF